MRLFPLTGLLCCLLCFAACAPRQSPVYRGPQEVRDLARFPQDLTRFLGSDRDQAILSAAEADSALAKWNERFFGSWHMSQPSISKRDVDMFLKRKARGWKNGTEQWTTAEWMAMRSNALLKSWPNVNRPGITVRDADLREMPTMLPRFSDPTPVPADHPFDDFQYSRLPVGMPVLLCQKSADGRWYYVETSLVAGWVLATDLAETSEDFMRTWEAAARMAVVQENVDLGGDRAGIGVVLPAAGASAVMVPVKGKNGMARMEVRTLPEGSVECFPLTMTPANVARLGNLMMNQKYGWGGMLGLRDCSSMTRDLMTPFGVWLPRNSQAQARAGERISLKDLPSAPAREKVVLDKGVPFASLVTLKDHVVLYVGRWMGRPAIMHDLWGIRVDEPEGEDNRLIIGRIVVTSMTPGSELPNLTNDTTIGDRFHTLTTLGGGDR